LVAGAALGVDAGARIGIGAALLFVVLLLDPILLEVHELLEGKENRAFLLFSHESGLLRDFRGAGIGAFGRGNERGCSLACRRHGAKP